MPSQQSAELDESATVQRFAQIPSPTESGPYEILEKLGQGGMGVVYKARDKRLDRVVALKQLSGDQSTDASSRRRLLKEARAAARLDHPNICTVYSVDEIGGTPCIAMQLVEGRTLRQVINEGPMPLDRFFDLAGQIASALDAAHRKDIIHRDIKSANIMVTAEGRVKVLDFGLAQFSSNQDSSRLTETAGDTAGTLSYMAPEQLRGGHANARSDVWSLGVVLFEMLTGKLPFQRETPGATVYAILNDDPPFITSVRAEIPESVSRLVQKALAKDPERRYHGMSDLLADLQACSGRSLVLPAPPSQRRVWLAAVSLAVVAVVVGTMVAVTGSRSTEPAPPSNAPPRSIAAAAIPAATQVVEAPAQSVAKGLPSIAALPFSNLNRDPKVAHLESGIADALAEAVVGSGRFRLVERSQLDQIIKELKLDRSEFVDPATAQKVGRLIGAQFLVIGSFQVFEGQLRLNARLLRVETGEVVGAWKRTGAVRDAFKLPDELARDVVEAARP